MAGAHGNRTHPRPETDPADGFEDRGRHQPPSAPESRTSRSAGIIAGPPPRGTRPPRKDEFVDPDRFDDEFARRAKPPRTRTEAPPKDAGASARLHLGLDLGGSRLRAALLDPHLVSKRLVTAGGGNARAVDVAGLERALRAALRALETQEPGFVDRLDVIAIGAAGAGSDDARARVVAALHPVLPGRDAFVVTDAEAALAGVTDDPAARGTVAVIAGTGSIAVGRASDGAFVRAGGLGFPAGDEGGGAWIGRSAVERGLVRAAIAADDAPGFARLVSGLAERAEAGEREVRKLFGDAARHLATIVFEVIDRVAPRDDVRIGLHGGLFDAGDLVRAPLETAIRVRVPGATIASLEVAVVRAALVARGSPLP